MPFIGQQPREPKLRVSYDDSRALDSHSRDRSAIPCYLSGGIAIFSVTLTQVHPLTPEHSSKSEAPVPSHLLHGCLVHQHLQIIIHSCASALLLSFPFSIFLIGSSLPSYLGTLVNVDISLSICLQLLM